MSGRNAVARLLCGFLCVGAIYAFQRPFREFQGMEYRIGDVPLPEDYQVPAEWAFARLMFPPGPLNGYRGRDWEWHRGRSLWTQDFPRADRHFSLAVRRLTRVSARSAEQIVNLEEGDAYDWPWLYAVQVGEWGLTDELGQQLREYCERGGFFLADDLHASAEWYEFESRIKKAFPNRPIEEIPDDDPIFNTVYSLRDKIQIVGWEHLRDGHKGDATGIGAHWRGVRDDKGRLLLAVCYNSDTGDAWEYADDPRYPQAMADQSIKLGVNSIVYSMTH
jgi:hypothetical protein